MTFSIDHSSDPLHCSSLPPSEDKRNRTPKIPTLQDLVSSTRGSAVVSCPQGNLPINSKPTTNTSHLLVSITKYKIPFQIHQTVKTRCVTPEVHALLKSWQDLGIPYYLHDDHSMDALILSEASDAFPQLKIIWKQCLRVPAAKADLWRMLLLWTYGGIYADIDSKPVSFNPFFHILPNDDMYTMSDNDGLPSFHFIAAIPKHPLIFLTIQHGLEMVLQVSDVGSYNPARYTGPKALKKAMRSFLRGTDNANKTQHQNIQSKVANFTFLGMGGYTLRREGPPEYSNRVVMECALPNKRQNYQRFAMRHYSDGVNMNQSCLEALFNYTRK